MNKSVKDATNYLRDVWEKRDSEELCSYGIALAACALALTPADSSNVSHKMIKELKSRIQSGIGKLNKIHHNYD